MIKHKSKIIVGFIIISILVLSFFWNGNSTIKRETELTNETISVTHNTEEEKIKDASKTIAIQEESPDERIITEEDIQPLHDEQTAEITLKENTKPIQKDEKKTAETIPKENTKPIQKDEKKTAETIPKENTKPIQKDEKKTEQATPKENQKPIQQDENTPTNEKTPPHEKSVVEDNAMTCSISVRCDTVLENMQYLDKNKQNIIPKDGIMFENQNAAIYEGESVFTVLVRELKKNKIHFEYTKTPMYNSVYIEGIGNLYEFDCGELSGWLYKVNGSSPGCGCSQYILKDNDVVEFIYSCNMGKDIGGYKALSGE